MDTRTTVEEFMDALDAGDFEAAVSYLADDFVFSTNTGESMNKEQWLGMSMNLRQGFPDLSYNFQIEAVDGNHIEASSSLTGTHDGDLDLTPMGIGVVPATGIYVEAPREYSEGHVENGQIQEIHVHNSPDTGIAAMLDQIGVQPG